MKTKSRVYLDPANSILTELDKVAGVIGFTRKQAIAEAVTLYVIFIEEIKAGRKIGTMEPGTRSFVRITTPGFRVAGINKQ